MPTPSPSMFGGTACVLGCTLAWAAELEVVCKLAYGDAPTDPAKMAINALLAWQHWVTAPTLHVATGATR